MSRALNAARSGVEEERRRQLIEATVDALAAVGFAAASLSEIAGRAGFAPASSPIISATRTACSRRRCAIWPTACPMPF